MTESIDLSTSGKHHGGGRRAAPPLSRRALIIGAVPVVSAALAAGGALAVQWSRTMDAQPAAAPPTLPANQVSSAATPPATPVAPARSTPFAGVTPRAATAVPALQRSLPNIGVPEGMALVASPRLSLASVGVKSPWQLLNGQVKNWEAVGSAVPLAVRPIALASETVSGMQPERTFADYDALAAHLSQNAGAVALVPTGLVDFRVRTLIVGEDDPLGNAIDGIAPMRIGVIGDIVPGRNVHLHMEKYGDFTRPFLRMAPLLKSFDLTVANLEGNLSTSLAQPEDAHSFSFVSSPAMLDGMALAGIDALTLANNHTVWNGEGWGLQGLLDTVAALESFGMPYFGAGMDLSSARAPWVTEVGGVSIAFLGIDGVTANYEAEPGVQNGVLDFDAGATADRPGTNPLLVSQVLADIAAATAIADVVIPYFHFGAEYVAIPPPWATQTARLAIDAGAALVVSNHPHVNQGMEIYAGRPIVYSPGNFILDQMWAAEVRSGYVLEIVLRGATITGLRFHGVEIEEFHQPRPMSFGEQSALMDRFWAASDRIAQRDGTA